MRAEHPGSGEIKQILRSRLPERFSGKLPPFLVELAVAVVVTAFFFAMRVALAPWTGEIAPFALVFVAVVGSAVLAGWRSGLLALVFGQLLTWYFLVQPHGAFFPLNARTGTALVMATVAQLLALTIITLYQREIALAWSRREGQFDLLQKALKEIDHRTANNYQTVIALILAQAKQATDPAVKDALQHVAGRIRAIADASKKLALSSETLDEVRVAEHLRDLCAQIEQGLGRPGVELVCDLEDIAMRADQTVCISILVNELVTNALKHAFPADRPGVIRVSLARDGRHTEVVVADDGVGMDRAASSRGTGLGTQLIATFARQLDADYKVTTGGEGTSHRLRIPASA